MTLIYDEDDDSQYIDIDEDQILSGLSAQELEQLEVKASKIYLIFF